MKVALMMLIVLCSSVQGFAQPEIEEAEDSEYIFKVKRFVIGKKPDTVQTLAAPVVVDTLQESASDSAETVQNLSETVVKLPKIIRGTISLMDIRPYDPSIDLTGKKYIVFQHIINKYGWAQDVQIHTTNDRRLIPVVLRKLERTQWSPARNAKDEAVSYTTQKLIILVNQRTYEVDYYDNY